MTPERGFVLFLLLTLALLGVVVATGLRRVRRLHLACVPATLAALALSIHFAKGMGAHYDLASAGAITPAHLLLAKVATACYLLPIATGILTLRAERWRPWHRRAAFLVVALTLLTALTGTWMLLAAERLPAP
jgi:hypothetical protein